MKLGVIGLGRRSRGLLDNFRKHAADFSVVGVMDSNTDLPRSGMTEEEHAKVRFYESIDTLVREAKPDALFIGTWCDTHTPMAIEAAKYDLPLFLEKPVSTGMEQALALEAAFRNTKCRVLVSFPLRATTLCRKAKELLDQGAAGRAEHVLAFNYVKYGQVYFDTRYRDYSVTEGLFLQKATHDFDYLSYLVGSPITRVAAMHSLGRVYRDTKTRGATPDPDAIYLDDIGTPETGMNEDSSSALLEFANGAKGVYTQLFFPKRTARRGVTLTGTQGLVEFDWYQSQIKVTRHREPISTVVTAEGEEDHWGGDNALARNFIDMVREGAPSLAPIRAGLESVYACLAAKESALTGRFVEVREPEGI